MKKVLSTVLALGLVAGAASLASAADPVFTMSGFYNVEGIYATHATNAAGVNVHANSDDAGAWFQHHMRVNPKLAVNDKVSLFSEIRLMQEDQTWGTAAGPTNNATAGNIDFNRLYMEYKAPVGLVRVGRNPFGSYGTSNFLDFAQAQDGITFMPEIAKPFSATLVYAKLKELDGASATVNDGDNDYYSAAMGYQDAGLNAGLNLRTYQDHTVAATLSNKHSIRGFAKYDIDKSMFVNFQFDHYFGGTKNDVAAADIDYDQTAVFGQFQGTFSGVTTGIMAWWLTGDDNAADNKSNAYKGTGKDFEPLLIATGHQMGLLNSCTTSIYSGAIQNAGAKAVGVYVSYPVSADLTLVGVLGSAWADKAPTGIDAHMGWEGDINASYKLLDNLTYGVGAGYFATGDFFKAAGATYESSIILVKNSLNMTF